MSTRSALARALLQLCQEGDLLAEPLEVPRPELFPGQRLSEAAFSDRFDVSRNSLREAFRLLTKDGLLRHEANRGVFVAVPSMASIIDIYRVRRMLECGALRQAWQQHECAQQTDQ